METEVAKKGVFAVNVEAGSAFFGVNMFSGIAGNTVDGMDSRPFSIVCGI